MHLEQTRYFALLYEIRNASAAARMIPISPQGLMKSIRSLETEFGVRLFTEENGVLTPTAHADAFYRFALSWQADHSCLVKEFTRISAQERQEIRLGTSLGIIGFIGADFLDSFIERHPSVSISYNELNDAFCEENLLDGTYDLAFTLAPYDDRFTTTELYQTQVYFWANTSMGYAQGDSLSIEDLSGKDIAMPGKDFKIFKTIMGLCRVMETDLGHVFTSNEIFWLYEYAAAGRGLAFTLPHLMELSTFTSNDNVVALPLKHVTWRFGLSHLSSRKLLPHEKQFLDFCKAELAGLP